MKDKNENSNFVEREWNEDIKGELDEDGFFVTPNGSFWDPDYVYFNREGYDKHGGRYNDKGEYVPGKGWDKENNCYESEKEDFDEFDDEGEEGFHRDFNIGNEDAIIDDLEDDLFDIDINDDNIQQIIKECSPFTKTNDEKNEESEKKENIPKEEIPKEETPKEEEKKDETIGEDSDKKEEKSDKDQKEEKKKNNSKDNSHNKKKGKIIITRENQEKYLDGKLLDDIKKNSEDLPNNNNKINNHNDNDDNKAETDENLRNKGNNNNFRNKNKKNNRKNNQNNYNNKGKNGKKISSIITINMEIIIIFIRICKI